MGSGRGGCQGGWERRIEAFVKINYFFYYFFFLVGGVGSGGGASGWGVRVDVNREVKFLLKFKKKIFEGGGVGSGRVGVGGVRSGVGVGEVG